MDDRKTGLTHATGAPVADNTNILTAGPRGPALLQDVWLIEKLAHFDREVITERRVHAKGSGAFGTLKVTHDISRYTKAKVFDQVGKETPIFIRFSTVPGERGAADVAGDRTVHPRRGQEPPDPVEARLRRHRVIGGQLETHLREGVEADQHEESDQVEAAHQASPTTAPPAETSRMPTVHS